MSDDYTTTPNFGLYKPTPNADYDLWGDHLNANADKLDTVISAIAVAGNVSLNQIDAAAYGAVADFVQLTGTIGWSGTTVTISGASFTTADVGKTLIMPAGGVAVGQDAPALVTITAVVGGGSCSVDTVAANAFSGLSNIVGGGPATPSNITVAVPGAGGSFVGDVLTLVAPAIRAATTQVIQTRVVSATVVNAGTGGPVGPVLLRGTTGYGRRVTLSGNVNAGGSLDPTLVVSSASLGADPGAYWYDVDDPNNEPVLANPRTISYPARWDTVTPAITLDAAQVSPAVMSSIHVGALMFAVDDANRTAFPPHTLVTGVGVSPSLTITVSNTATLNNGSSGPQPVAFTDNRNDIAFTATFASNSTTVTATATLPSGVVVGQVIYGTGISGIDDPVNPAANTTIVSIAGTTVTISRPTTQAATTAVTLHAAPYLTGAIVKLNLVPAVVAFKDFGAYAGAPGALNTAFATTRLVSGTPAPTDIQLLISEQYRTRTVSVSMGTDNTTQINAWLDAARTAMVSVGGAAAIGGFEAIMRPGQYLACGSLNAKNLTALNLTLRMSGVVIHSAAKGLRAWDASGARYFRWVGDFLLQGDRLFPPDIGILLGYSTANQVCAQLTLQDVQATGWFGFAAIICGNMESSNVANMVGNNAQPWPDKNTPTFGRVIDGDNSYNKMDAPAFQTHGSFVGFLEDNGQSQCSGGAVPYSIVGCGGYVNRHGYAASWSAPAIWFSKSGNSKLDIHCEVATLTDAVFMWARSNNVVSFSNSLFDDNALFATNSVFSYDVLGKFGVAIEAFDAANSKIAVGFSAPYAQVFDDTTAFLGSLAFHGEIYVSGVLKTATPHWLNFPDDREGVLLLGDDKTNFAGDFIQGSTLVSAGIISAGDDISTTGWVNAEDGIRIGAVGFPRANLTFDGTQINSNVPISLPSGSTGAFLPLTGGTVTGATTFSSTMQALGGVTAGNATATGGANISINGAVANQRMINLYTAGSQRWRFGANGTAEGGSNAGSDFFINAYNDSGTGPVAALTINRATQQTAVPSVQMGTAFTYAGQAASNSMVPLFITANYSGSTDHTSWTGLNNVNINSDVLDVGAGQQAIGLYWNQNFGGAGITGGRTGARFQLTQTGAAPANANYQAGLFSTACQFSSGGTNLWGGSAGVAFGGATYSRLQSGATNYRSIVGHEIDYGIDAGASAAGITGLQIVRWSTHAVPPLLWELDIGYGLANAAAGNGAKIGYSFSVANGYWGIDPTNGRLFGAGFANDAMQAAHGVDLYNITLTGTQFRGKGFSVLGSGSSLPGGTVQVGGGYLSSSAAIVSLDTVGSVCTAAAIAAGGANIPVNAWLVHDATGTLAQVTTVSAGVATAITLISNTGRSLTAAIPANPVTFRVTGNTQFTFAGAPTAPTLNLTWTASTTLALQPSGGATTAGGTLSVGLAGTNDVLTITPGAASANAIVFAPSGTGGFQFAGNIVATSSSIQAQTTLTSGTVSGTSSGLTLQAAVGNTRAVTFNTGALNRWQIRANPTAEGGSNAGTDLDIFAYNDAGTINATPALRFTRSTGNAQFWGSIGVNGTAPPTKPTGWGSSTGGARAAITASSTLPQVAAGLAQLLNDLTAYGLIGV